MTGYPAPAEHVFASHSALDEFVGALEQKGVVLDLRDAIEREASLVARSPYVDPFLDPGTAARSKKGISPPPGTLQTKRSHSTAGTHGRRVRRTRSRRCRH